MEWIYNKCPDKDGLYIVATQYYVQSMNFTTAGGWNTHISNGILFNEYAMSDDSIVAWMPMPDYPTELKKRLMDCPSEEW